MRDSPPGMSSRFGVRLVVLVALAGSAAAWFAPVATAASPNAPAMPTSRKPDRERGRDLWLQSCWECHGTEGKGDGPAADAVPGGVPSLEGKVPDSRIDELVDLVEDGKGRMPAYREDIDKHDARRILKYLQDALAGHPEAKSEKEGEEKDEGPQN